MFVSCFGQLEGGQLGSCDSGLEPMLMLRQTQKRSARAAGTQEKYRGIMFNVLVDHSQ
jgi:hypothetical protein